MLMLNNLIESNLTQLAAEFHVHVPKNYNRVAPIEPGNFLEGGFHQTKYHVVAQTHAYHGITL